MSTFDISDTLTPTSDQLDAVDLIGNPRTFTIADVSKGSPEQPVQITLAEFPRVWRPGKSMRRVLAACWGTDAKQWVGRRVTLFCDERVQFGSEVVGGTRISHLSHIDKRRSVPLIVKRGKSASWTVEPVPDDAPTLEPVKGKAAERAALVAEWETATAERKVAIQSEVARIDAELSQPADPGEHDPTTDPDWKGGQA